MGFLDFFSNNITSISLARDVFTTGLDAATVTLEQGGVAIDQAADDFNADQPPPENLDVPPTAELAPAATFFEPTQYFGNYSLIDPKYQPVSSYVQDNSFLYSKEINNFTPRLSDFVMDFGKIVTLDGAASTQTPAALSENLASSTPENTTGATGDSPATGEVQQQLVADTSSAPVQRLLTSPVTRFDFTPVGLELSSGESAMGGRIVNLTSSLDDLMQRASTLDPSTKEGQAELAQIQLDFAQAQRFLQSLSQLMESFNQLQKSILQNR
jgi:hypothetical protein